MDPLAHAAGPLHDRVLAGDLVVGEDGPQRDGGVGGDAGDVDGQRRLVPQKVEPLDTVRHLAAAHDPVAGGDAGFAGALGAGRGVGPRRGGHAEQGSGSRQRDHRDGCQRPGQSHRRAPFSGHSCPLISA